MESNRIEEIIRRVYGKAKMNCASHSNHALSTYVSNHTGLSYKTIERSFDLYVNSKSDIGEPNEATVNILCKFLGYENYAEFVNDNRVPDVIGGGGKWKILIAITVIISSILVWVFYSMPSSDCMVWSKTHYEKVACDKKYDKVVEPIDPVKLANFKKIEVTLSTPFFDEATSQPLIWYHKTKEGSIEYFTAPGLHPIKRKTLDEITPYIIEKYVPKHDYKPDSFIENK